MSTDSNGKPATGGQGIERQAARSTASPRSDSPARPAAVVGIGASAGGVEALDELFRDMPSDTGMAFVVITHQPPDHESLLPELLGKHTPMTVAPASHGLKLAANHIYVSPPGGQLTVRSDSLCWRETGNESRAPHMPIDAFLRSLAQEQQHRAICIILSGTGSDGTLGLRAIKEHLGVTLVQEPSSAAYDDMPASAIATELADFVLPPADMPAQLSQWAPAPILASDPAAAEREEDSEGLIKDICRLLYDRLGHDFSAYKYNTIRRRIERRMSLQQIATYQAYVEFLHENPDELDLLFRELLIRVTYFFRDAEAWEALASHVESMFRKHPDARAFRAWVPACCTGEEVFSLIIILHECMEKLGRRLDIQVFGTDLDHKAIATARRAEYPEGIANDVSPPRLQRYFAHQHGSYRIRKEIRELAVFAPHNVLKDPPFTRLDLLSCRNLLIYFESDLQKKLLPAFHYALNTDGLLFLGPSESVGAFPDLFDTLDRPWKIFRRKDNSFASREIPALPLPPPDGRDSRKALPRAAPTDQPGLSRMVEKLLLDRFAPTCAIVNGSGEIAYLYGRTGNYLEPPEGRPSNNILAMAREGLEAELAHAIRRCAADTERVERCNIEVKRNGEAMPIDMTVEKLHNPKALRDMLVVTFRPARTEPEGIAARHAAPTDDEGAPSRLESLERELRYSKESHQSTLEDLETSNEELKSTNEELQSSNEELQSTNEELETSREELHSLNEELTTVNAELKSKVEDLAQSNDDMQNLLNSTRIATIFVDKDLAVRRYTEQAREVIALRPGDIGRPVSELASNLQHQDIEADCRAVLDNLTPREAEVQSRDNCHYLMRVMPYRTASNVIEGLVLTFVDINRLKQTQRDLRHMSEIFHEGAYPAVITNLDGHVIDLNGSAARAFGYTLKDIRSRPLQAMVPQSEYEPIREHLSRCREGDVVSGEPGVFLSRDGHEIGVTLELTLLTRENGEADAIAVLAKPVDQ